MIKENKRGASRLESGGFRKKGVLVLASAILAVAPGIAKARYYWHRYRTRYSPYAFSYKYPSGLVSGELEYSPYAFSHENPSGLIPYWYRYSPYAFSHENPSGLISDYGFGYWYYPHHGHVVIDCNINKSRASLVERVENDNKGPSYEQRLAARKALVEQRIKEAEERKQQEGLDEFILFKGYFDSLNIPHRLAKMSSCNQTVVVRIDFPTYPNVIIEWRDDSLLKDTPSWFHTVYERGRNDYLGQGKTIAEITETSSDKITSRLEEIVVRYQLQKRVN